MADNNKIREEVKTLTQRLETGIQDLYTSEKYAAYLATLSRFHNYSTRNTMLIHLQMPGATHVAGFNKWKNEFERHVTKGQKGIRVFAPAPYTIKKEMEQLDPETQAPMLDKDGNAIVEEVDVSIPAFKPVSVFDVSQTDGKPLPILAENITGDVQQYDAFLDALRDVTVMPIGLEPLAQNIDSVCRYDSRTIAIREGMSEVQTVSAILHEMTHAELHDYNLELEQQEQEAEVEAAGLDGAEEVAPKPRNRRAEEVEAESVSYVVCQHYGIETGDNSFGYIASWSKGKELDELKASLDIIRKTAASMIERIDGRFAEICKERGIDLSPVQAEQEQTADTSVLDVGSVEPMPEKQYDLSFGHLGNGLTVWNRLEETDGDYRTVAHIDPDRKVTFYDKDMPDSVKAEIEKAALTSNITVSETQDAPVFAAPAQNTEPEHEPAALGTEAEGEHGTILPDSSIGLAERDLYGYTDPAILPMLQERALELFDQDLTVYLLYQDGTEAMAFDRPDIENHDGIFGIEGEDWQASQDFELVKARLQEREASKEAGLVYGKDDTYTIYQLKGGDEARDYRFESLESLEARGLAVDRNKYNLVYSAPLTGKDTLDSIYQKFNVDRPADFTGHSLSMSDVIVLQQDGNTTAHYVDRFDIEELPDFFKDEKQPEIASTDVEASAPPTPTVAELEAQAEAGRQISLHDFAKAIQNEQPAPKSTPAQNDRRKAEKPSIIGQIREAQQAASRGREQQKNAPKRNSEREV